MSDKVALGSSPFEHALLNSGPPTARPTIVQQAPEAPKKGRILFGVPKKGRLHTIIMQMLKGSGLSHVRPNRLDVAHCDKLPVTLVFLPAADIAKYVGEGNVDMGITGQDIVAETGMAVETLQELGIGKCSLAVQAPVGQYTDPEQLAGKRIVTSFPRLAKEFFGKMDAARGDGVETQVKYVSGSVEVACHLGLADGIIDLVETGTTMRAAGLEKIGTVMATQTVLIANTHTNNRALVDKIHKRINGFLLSQKCSMLAYNIPASHLEQAKLITPGEQAPTVSTLGASPTEPTEKWVSVTVLVRSDQISDMMDQLEEVGAKGLVVFNVSNCRF